MKIVVFFTFGVSLKDWNDTGLIERETFIYKELYKNHKIETYLITYGCNDDFEYSHLLGEGIKVFPIYKNKEVPSNKLHRLISSLLAPFFLKKTLQQAVLYKTNQFWGSWTAVISKLLYKKPLVLRSGYNYYDFAKRLKRSMLFLIVAKIILSISMKFSDKILVATENDLNDILDNFKVDKKKFNIRPNWINTNKFLPIDMPKSIDILCVGRLEPVKNILFILSSLSNETYNLKIYGSGSQAKILKKYAKKTKLEVSFMGNAPNNEMPDIYNSSQIYLLCSKYEGNPKTLLEAMSCGSCVIGLDSSGINNIIKDNENGILINESENELLFAVKKLMTNETKKKLLGANARKFIQENHSIENFLDEEIKMINSLVL